MNARAESAIAAAARAAREASYVVSVLSTETKNDVLRGIAGVIETNARAILVANTQDMAAARQAKLAESKLQRLELTSKSLEQLAKGLRQVADLPDPVGEVTRERRVPSGLLVKRVRSPLGVIAMIYEARPGVTADAFALCFKAGNACVLKGGREAANSNAALAALVHGVLRQHRIPEAALSLITTSDRDELKELLTLDRFIDLIIPRGGTDLIRFVVEHSTIPTIQHYQGVCHIYVEASADLDMAERVCVTAKTSAPATCNSTECVLVDEMIAEEFVPRLVEAYARTNVEVRGDAEVCRLARNSANVTLATDADWGCEFLDLIVAVRVVQGIDEAISHIHRYSSNHTEAILTRDGESAAKFTSQVQSSCVFVNASTRFNDGFQLGLGAEIGISTSKLHAFGPMGLEELTIQRYVVVGDGQTR